MCAQITDFSKKGGNGLGIVEYSNIEAGVQTSYAAVEVEITDSVPDSDGNKPTQKPALAAVLTLGTSSAALSSAAAVVSRCYASQLATCC